MEEARSVTRWEEWTGNQLKLRRQEQRRKEGGPGRGNGLTVTMPVMVTERCEAAAVEKTMGT